MGSNKKRIIAEDVTHLFDRDYFSNLLEIEDKQMRQSELTVIIDNNYLIQINREDLLHMFFDKNYPNNINNPLKKQMAMLFASQNSGEINIFISNMIYREFVRVSPEKTDLLVKYKKYLNLIGSKREYESYFLDLANLLTLRANREGFKAEISDTYSFLIANLANIKYFISDDSDLKGIFRYLLKFRDANKASRRKEIDWIVKMTEKLYEIKPNDFPVRKIVERLFVSKHLTLPISIKDVSRELPKIEEDTRIVINICNLVNELLSIGELSGNESNLINNARDSLTKICQKMGKELPEKQGKIDVYNLSTLLIENEKLWTIPQGISKVHETLFQALEDVYARTYEEEKIFDTWEEIFSHEVSDLEAKIRCECGHEFSDGICYGGIVASEAREMGNELMHVWNNDMTCPECGKLLTVELTVWEYPVGLLNFADCDNSNCTVLNEKELGSKVGITIE